MPGVLQICLASCQAFVTARCDWSIALSNASHWLYIIPQTVRPPFANTLRSAKCESYVFLLYRDRFMAEMNNSDGDSVLAALYLAAEDDAVQTCSTVELPTASFSKRLDTLVASARGSLQASQPLLPHQAVKQIPELLFGGMGFRTAKQSLELYSPYRIYMHKVLTQRCGTPEALGALLAAFMVRLQRAGLVEQFPVELGLAGPGVAPSVRVAEATQSEQGEHSTRCDPGLRSRLQLPPKCTYTLKASTKGDNAQSRSTCATSVCACRWRTGLQCVAECLSQLKRTNWSWDWYTGNPDSFELPAEAFLGSFGRANVGSAVVGVMQATGRPFGDLDLALLDCQRLACVAATEREQMRNVRDQGVLLCHLQRYPDAQAALERYEQWVAAHPDIVAGADAATSAESLIQQRELQLIHDVKLKLAQLSLEAAYSSS